MCDGTGMDCYNGITGISWHIDSTEHYRSMMMVIAFESLIKLAAFLAVGIFALSLFQTAPQLNALSWPLFTYTLSNIGSLFIYMLLTMAAIICLPRQFYTIVVEIIAKLIYIKPVGSFLVTYS